MCEPEVVADVFMCHRFHHNCLKQFKLLLELLYQHHSCNDPDYRVTLREICTDDWCMPCYVIVSRCCDGDYCTGRERSHCSPCIWPVESLFSKLKDSGCRAQGLDGIIATTCRIQREWILERFRSTQGVLGINNNNNNHNNNNNNNDNMNNYINDIHSNKMNLYSKRIRAMVSERISAAGSPRCTADVLTRTPTGVLRVSTSSVQSCLQMENKRCGRTTDATYRMHTIWCNRYTCISIWLELHKQSHRTHPPRTPWYISLFSS